MSMSVQAQTTRWLNTNLPHFYEFDPNDDPHKHYWCGHAALKVSMMYWHGLTKSLSSIHHIFRANSYKYRSNKSRLTSSHNWCASLQDLAWAQYPRNGGYGTIANNIGTGNHNGLRIKKPQNIYDFFNFIKSAINANQPVIIPSRWHYRSAGHFWIVTDYTDWGSPYGSALYLRDVAIPYPAYPNADKSVFVQDFYSGTNSGQMLVIQWCSHSLFS